MEKIYKIKKTFETFGWDSRHSNRLNGFSFLELMVTITIISIMTAVLLNSLSGNKELKAVEGEARKFAAAIREAQNYALTGRKISSTAPTCGWGINIPTGGTRVDYNVFYNFDPISPYDCADFNTDSDNRKYQLGQSTNFNYYKLEKVKFDIAGSVRGAYFTIPFGSAYDNNGGSPVSPHIEFHLISQTNPNAKYTVCLYSSGRVEEKAPGGTDTNSDGYTDC